jgi:RNA-binding protein
MPQIQLTPAERKVHRALAHHLDPVVMIGGDGLTPAVLREANAALSAHGLIKIRVLGDDRAARELMYQTLANELNAAPIQHIGKLLVLWRPIPEKEKTVDEDRMPGPRDFKVLEVQQTRRPASRGQDPSRAGQPAPDLGRPDQARQAEDEVHQESPSRLTHCA